MHIPLCGHSNIKFKLRGRGGPPKCELIGTGRRRVMSMETLAYKFF